MCFTRSFVRVRIVMNVDLSYKPVLMYIYVINSGNKEKRQVIGCWTAL